MSDTLDFKRRLPVGSIGHKANGWWGMLTLVATEGALFAYLLFSYFYFQVQAGRAFLPDKLPEFKLAGPNTAILVASSVVLWWAERQGRKGHTGRLSVGLVGTLVLGVAFVAIQLVEWHGKTFTPWSSAYGSLFYGVTGFHMAHVIVGLVVLLALLGWNLLGYFDARRHAAVSIGALYWHFVDAVWLTVFLSLYVTPRLL
jgi:cytochrome c oxidase subunit III